jgi:hypothetical protein
MILATHPSAFRLLFRNCSPHRFPPRPWYFALIRSKKRQQERALRRSRVVCISLGLQSEKHPGICVPCTLCVWSHRLVRRSPLRAGLRIRRSASVSAGTAVRLLMFRRRTSEAFVARPIVLRTGALTGHGSGGRGKTAAAAFCLAQLVAESAVITSPRSGDLLFAASLPSFGMSA